MRYSHPTSADPLTRPVLDEMERERKAREEADAEAQAALQRRVNEQSCGEFLAIFFFIASTIMLVAVWTYGVGVWTADDLAGLVREWLA